MATWAFMAGSDFTIDNLSGSGLGFFGAAGFGSSVTVSAYNDKTYITNGAGTIQGAECDNVKFANSGSGYVAGASSGISLTCIPNYQATLQLRFSHDSAVQVSNVKLRIYDRSNVDNPASGVTVKVAELIHPNITQDNSGSGDTVWIGTSVNGQTGTATVGGSGIVVTLANSPGPSGLFAGNGSNSSLSNKVHDWYVAISASPDSIGSKTLFGLFCECDYL